MQGKLPFFKHHTKKAFLKSYLSGFNHDEVVAAFLSCTIKKFSEKKIQPCEKMAQGLRKTAEKYFFFQARDILNKKKRSSFTCDCTKLHFKTCMLAAGTQKHLFSLSSCEHILVLS